RPINADEIIYGGLGDDFLHSGAGDDAISGAEVLSVSYVQVWTVPGSVWLSGAARSDLNRPFNPGDALRFNAKNSVNYNGTIRADEFALYDEFHAMQKIMLD